MCMQCMAAAGTAVGTAMGTRAWIVTRIRYLATPRRRRAATAILVTLAVVASALGLGSA